MSGLNTIKDCFREAVKKSSYLMVGPQCLNPTPSRLMTVRTLQLEKKKCFFP